MIQEDVNRFEEIMNEIMRLCDEAMTIVRQSGNSTAYEQAKAYWKGHIHQAVGNEDNEYVGKATFSMNDTLEKLQSDVEPDDVEPDEDEPED